jgi:O-antigen/teichoic acid export membrane protein
MNLLLIPRFGVYGAAAGSFISNLSYLILYYFIIRTNVRKQLTLNYPAPEQ